MALPVPYPTAAPGSLQQPDWSPRPGLHPAHCRGGLGPEKLKQGFSHLAGVTVGLAGRVAGGQGGDSWMDAKLSSSCLLPLEPSCGNNGLVLRCPICGAPQTSTKQQLPTSPPISPSCHSNCYYLYNIIIAYPVCHLILTQCWEVGMIIPILQMGRLRAKEEKIDSSSLNFNGTGG